MLVALLAGKRIQACHAEKGAEYFCPNPECNSPVVLHKGDKVIHHFKHYPGKKCDWAAGETQAHLEAKKLFADHYSRPPYRAEEEYYIDKSGIKRRADVRLTSKNTKFEALIELQHTTISIPDIKKRAFDYARLDVAQIWIPFLSKKRLAAATERVIQNFRWLTIERFSPRPYELWIEKFLQGEIWFYDSDRTMLWRGRFLPCTLWKESSEFYDEDGELQYYPGGSYPAKKLRSLILLGPYRLGELKIYLRRIRKRSNESMRFPNGLIALFKQSNNK